ncbi:hypothetical protein FQZ97_971080 [compost metagenome]
MLLGNPHVGETGPFQAAGVGDAVHRGDHRLVEVGPATGAKNAWAFTPVVGGDLVCARGDQIKACFQVATRAKGLVTAAGDDGHQSLVIFLESCPGFDQLPVCGGADAISFLGAIEADDPNLIVRLVGDFAECHGQVPLVLVVFSLLSAS